MRIGIFGAVFLVLLVLKLMDVIDWGWFFVTLPLWGGVIVWGGWLLFLVIVAALVDSRR